MKKIIVTATMLIATSVVCAQTFEEWFKQKATQRKYLLRQIAALKVYGSHLSKGYQIVKSGLDIIDGIKQLDYKLHNNYFNSLKSISPALMGYHQLVGIQQLQSFIARHSVATIRFCSVSQQLSASEIAWLQNTFSSLLADCKDRIEALSSFLKQASLSLKDDERLARINEVYTSMQENASFCISFSTDCRAICMQRRNEQINIQQSESLNLSR